MPIIPSSIPDVTYKVRSKGKWSGEVKNCIKVAGAQGQPITDIAIKVTHGTYKYRVHVKAGKWLPWVTGYDINDDNNGYAGNGKEIDAIQINYNTPAQWVKLYGYHLVIRYRVSPVNAPFYPYQYDTQTTGGQDGYAGYFGKSIDHIQIEVIKKPPETK